MTQLTSEDIWYIVLGFGSLLTMSPGVFLLSSIYITKEQESTSRQRKYFASLLLLFLAFSFSFSGAYMALYEAANPIEGLPITLTISFLLSLVFTTSMYSLRQVIDWLKNLIKDR